MGALVLCIEAQTSRTQRDHLVYYTFWEGYCFFFFHGCVLLGKVASPVVILFSLFLACSYTIRQCSVIQSKVCQRIAHHPRFQVAPQEETSAL